MGVLGAARPTRAPLTLADAFAGEVGERLPELNSALVCALRTGDADAARVALRHVHTLASGAAVVGAGEVARRARRCEEMLLAALDPDTSADRAFHPDVIDQDTLLAEIEGVAVLLARWLARGAA